MVIRFSTPDRAGKHTDSFKRQQEMWRHAYAQATSLREQFPKVEEVLVTLSFVDAAKIGTYSARTYSFYPSAKAFFAVQCPRTLCLDGGFRLEEVVHKLLKGHKKNATGVLECGGSMQPPDSPIIPCGLHMQYQVEVRYEPTWK
jgi:hypothetical protein